MKRFNPLKPEPPSAAPMVKQRKAPQPPGATNFPVTLSENRQKDGLELRFPAKPSADVLADLKAHGWRWSRYNSCWYHRNTPEHRTFAERFLKQVESPESQVVSSQAGAIEAASPNIVAVEFKQPDASIASQPAAAWKRAFLRR